MEPSLTRRRFIQGAAATGALLALPLRRLAAAPAIHAQDFTAASSWGPNWHLDGVGNLLVRDGVGLVQGATRIAPADNRVTAFLRDVRVADATIVTEVERTGVLAGAVLRRVGPRHQYQAVLSSGGHALKLVRRTPAEGEVDLAAIDVASLAFPVRLTFDVAGAEPVQLAVSVIDALGRESVLRAEDATPSLAGAGDPGVLATAEIVSRAIWLAEGELGDTDLVAARLAIEELSTGAFRNIAVLSPDTPGPSTPSVVAAGTGVPVGGGAHLRVVTDVPARVDVEISADPSFTDPRLVRLGDTNAREVVVAAVDGLEPGSTVHWRARLKGPRGTRALGPARSFRVLPKSDDPTPVTIIVGSCAEEIGPIFQTIARERPDVFVWEGDLLYPDYVGPLMQTASGYAGWWKSLLAAPGLAPILDSACFATQRDDHDYGGNNTAVSEHGIEPYESVLHPEPYYSFSAGLLDVWVLDQRRWKSANDLPDTADKSLLGTVQREWLFDRLAASTAPYKLVCSPDPLFHPTNRDTNWGRGFTAERDLLLEHVGRNVTGRTIFVTGDSHSGAVIKQGGVLEVRASPMHTANHQASSGEGVLFSDTGRFFCLVRAGAAGLQVQLVRDDGSRAWETTIT